jgi:hypothetical protein
MPILPEGTLNGRKVTLIILYGLFTTNRKKHEVARDHPPPYEGLEQLFFPVFVEFFGNEWKKECFS